MQQSWNAYYNKVIKYPHRPMTETAVKLVGQTDRIAIDCGCGAGRDSAFLLDSGFEVHAFDMDADAVAICEKRFSDYDKFNVANATFADYSYPRSSLILARSSLFFCPEREFHSAWANLVDSLEPGGVFCGDLLGVDDSWVDSPAHDVTAFTREQVRALFTGFELLKFVERNEPGKTAIGHTKHWHTFTMLAVKR